MAHFAELDNNHRVIRVIVVNNDVLQNKEFPESEPIGIAFCRELFGHQTNWAQTSYSGSFRSKFAGCGYFFDQEQDAFVAPTNGETNENQSI